jgi:hypothetical protein
VIGLGYATLPLLLLLVTVPFLSTKKPCYLWMALLVNPFTIRWLVGWWREHQKHSDPVD